MPRVFRTDPDRFAVAMMAEQMGVDLDDLTEEQLNELILEATKDREAREAKQPKTK